MTVGELKVYLDTLDPNVKLVYPIGDDFVPLTKENLMVGQGNVYPEFGEAYFYPIGQITKYEDEEPFEDVLSIGFSLRYS